MTSKSEFQYRNLQKWFEDCMKYGDHMHVKRDIDSLRIIHTQEFTDWSSMWIIYEDPKREYKLNVSTVGVKINIYIRGSQT